MSIIKNGKLIAGSYKIQLAPEASTENAGVSGTSTGINLITYAYRKVR